MARVRTRAATAPGVRRKKPSVQARKTPTQERARQTVDAILEAAARVLVREGHDRASTNRIAEAAGVSIGSLYQYFPSKEAVVRALIEAHHDKMHAVMREHLADVGGQDIPSVVHGLIGAILEAHRVEPRLHKVLLEQVGSREGGSVDDVLETLVRAALESRRADLVLGDLDVATFILVSAVQTTCHRAVIERPELLASGAFMDELTALVVRYVTGGEGTKPPRRARRR